MDLGGSGKREARRLKSADRWWREGRVFIAGAVTCRPPRCRACKLREQEPSRRGTRDTWTLGGYVYVGTGDRRLSRGEKCCRRVLAFYFQIFQYYGVKHLTSDVTRCPQNPQLTLWACSLVGAGADACAGLDWLVLVFFKETWCLTVGRR